MSTASVQYLDDFGVGVLGPLLLCRWTKSVTPDQITLVAESHLKAREAGEVVTLCVGTVDSLSFSEEFRAACVHLMKTTEGGSVATALVYPKVGFGAATLRSFLSLMTFASREPLYFARTLDEGLRWLGTQAGFDVAAGFIELDMALCKGLPTD